MTRIACLKQLNARVPARVPRRWRSACSRLETYSTVSSRTVNVAVYVTLIRRRTPMKLDCERTIFIPGFCVFPLHHNRFRRVAAGAVDTYLPSPYGYTERLSGPILRVGQRI